MKKAKDTLLHILIKFFQWYIPLNSIRWVRRWGILIGIITFFLAKKGRERAIKQISKAFNITNKDAKALAKRNFVHLGKSITEFLYIPRITNTELTNLITSVSGREYLDQALSIGKGAIILTGHIGNWELGAIWLSMNGYKLNVIAATQNDDYIDNVIFSYRKMKGINIIPKNRLLKDAILTLKRKEFLGILIDQDAKEKGTILDFLGLPASTPTGIISLSKKFGSPIVPLFTIRQPDDTFKIEILSPIFVEEEKKTLQKLNDLISFYIKLYPEQWIWFYQRWKSTTPI